MTDAERFNWRLTYVLWSILLAGCMYLALTESVNKTIVIADTGYGQSVVNGEAESAERGGPLFLQQQEAEANTFFIPLAKGSKAENVVVENCYMERELRIYIKDAEQDFYESRAVNGDIASILAASWEMQSGGVLLRLRMDGIYEYRNSIEGERLKIVAGDPRESYRMIVVIDPSGGGSETGLQAGGCTEKEIALAVSGQLQSQIKNSGIKLYFTRTDDTEVSEEARCALVQEAGADLYVNIGLSLDEDSGFYGIRGRYNENYFIPGFGNVQLADILTRNVTVAAKDRAVGLQSAGEDSILRQLGLPAARVEVGYLSNEQERGLLAQEEYQRKLAEGIAKAIEEVYENYYE